MRLRNLLILLGLLALLACAPAAQAASVAGTNGKIAFSDGTDIWVMNADGSGAAQVTSAAGTNLDPAISPDGTKVAFASSRFGGFDIMVANLDGSGLFRLTSNVALLERRPVWSPDGTAIAYQAFDPSAVTPNWDIYTMLANGASQTAFSGNDSTGNDFDPSYAPDGSQLAFISDRTGSDQIWLAGPTGSNAYQVLFTAESDCQPTFSPDSRAIAYTAFCGGGAQEIRSYAFSAAVTTVSSGADDSNPAWSPDGTRIAFQRAGVGVATKSADGSGGVTSLGPAASGQNPDWGANLANVGLPTVSGNRTVGSTVVANSGSWLGQAPIAYTYQWMRCNLTGDGCQPIGGATGVSYQLTSQDASGSIRVQVTATNPTGSASALSSVIGSILQPAGPGQPVISGLLQVGSTLSTTTGSVGASLGLAPVLYTFQWLRCDVSALACVPIVGATSPTYVLTTADTQHTIRVAVTGTNSSGSASATSLATEVVGGLAPTNVVLPVVAGQPVIGQTLTASTGTWNGAASATYSYQWKSCTASGTGCLPVAGASGSTYVVTSDDVGSTLVVAVTATTANGIVSVESLPTAIVGASYADPGPGVPAVTIEPRLIGTAAVGSTVTVTGGGFVGSALHYSYQWQRCNTQGESCEPILWATGSSYKLQQPDLGSTIRVFVTASNGAGSASSVSDVTSTVVASASPSSTKSTKALVMFGTAHADKLVVKKGRNRVVAGAGNDTILAADGRREVIDCGPGRDTVQADRTDALRHCERVTYPKQRAAAKKP